MRTFDWDSADAPTVGPIQVARWEQYGLQASMPFGAMWYSVPAGASSLRDCHPELELSIVVAGTAFVECGGAVTEVPQGTAVLFDSEEAHIVHNRDSHAPLTIFSAYWMPLADPSEPAASASTETESTETESSKTESRTPGLEPAGV